MLSLLSTVKPAVNPKSAIEAQASVALTVTENKVTATASNGEIAIVAYSKRPSGTPGTAVVPPEPLMRYLSTHPKAEAARFTAGGGVLQVAVADLPPYTFRLLETSPPPIPDVDGEPLLVPWHLLEPGFVAVRSAVDPGTGLVQISRSDGHVSMTATDSYRLASVSAPVASGDDFRALVPASTIQTALRVGPTSVALDTRRRSIQFAGPDVRVVARTAVYPFPNVASVLATQPAPTVEVDVETLKLALVRLGSVVSSEPLIVQIRNSRLTLAATSRGIGSGRETLDVRSADVVDFRLRMDYRYLVEALDGHAEHLKLGWAGGAQPVFFTSDNLGGGRLTTVVMPVRGPED